MKVALISYEFPPVSALGGIGSYIQHLAEFLTLKGHKVIVFSALPRGEKLKISSMPYCINYRVPAVDNEAFRKNVLPVFEEYYNYNNVDVIESPEVGACAFLIKERFPELKLVVRMHTPGVLITKINNSQRPLFQKLRFVIGASLRGKIDLGYWASKDKNRDADVEYQICLKANSLISPSEALKKWAVKFWDFPAAGIKVIQNPFSLKSNLFSLPLTNRPLVISFIGKLSILKGMKALTAAIPLILEKNKGYKFILVGRDEVENGKSMKAYMQEKLAKYSSQIEFTGAVNQEALKDIYAQSRVCVFPSLWENYPTVILEAMAAGCAVAASKVGGILEIINHNKTGILFDPFQAGKIAHAVNELLNNEKKTMEMAFAARQHLEQQINNVQFEENLLKLYNY